MASKNKARAAGVSASSFTDLQAELARKKEAFAKAKAAGQTATASSPIFGGEKKATSKPTVWARQNKGVKNRAARDLEIEAVSKPTLKSARAVLERKAKIYEKLQKGKTGGLTEAQYNSLLVDFDSKVQDVYESDSDDVDESVTVPRPPPGAEGDSLVEHEDEFERTRMIPRSELPSTSRSSGLNDTEDPLVEYEDEFGRMRTARRSEVPRDLLPKPKPEEIPDDDSVLYNPTHHFPVYQPDPDRVAAIEKELAEANAPLNVHYDAAREVRAKGAGFYQFSADEETRRRQMEELKQTRLETERARREAGAVDLKPGETEGLRDEEGEGEGLKRSRAMEKRKRELEERRRLLDAKRRKVKSGPAVGDEPVMASMPSESSTQQPVALAQAQIDPFAALEAQVSSTQPRPVSAADDFLAQLERDVLGGKT
ncbi:hypothetical protein PUNSTDRAFT_109149 [Punctularia strigosozonata HHB-11173 SS5]|uniref:Coiled-coil domain-containing protein 174 n=1 Tax=Punctularia strigosozonata (strain HHB-11173) TaxID=741275 RepID=R7S1V8_PUNST|nr:uncharacterized protein PUNSTDRAFT_109149 [Punctularia strigosozonata HHB-11173 SS5]EIN03747.1 hypothetical protein PUNSTDRAFT_109149 [Punctularia strigosozonata HHB-11173 SS5]